MNGVAEIVRLLDAETSLCKDLVRELQEDQARVLQQDVPGLEESTRRKEDLVLRLQLLEQQRSAIARELGASLGVSPEAVCVSTLCARLGPAGSELEAAADRLRAVLGGLRELVAVGRGFLEQSILGIRGLLALIQSLKTPESSQTYDVSGRMATGKVAPAVAVRREV